MAYVITHFCTRDGMCVEVCPVGCIVPGPKGNRDWPLFYIDPARCVDCGACDPACPIGAILPDYEVPDQWLGDTELNARYFAEGPGYYQFDLEKERVRSKR